mmetsp:Transcript_21383/g.43026  ORF Transcript_21383/g.43026 Transcript_21383/m.43026 type:complete len:310 (-) Transcript_21383:956-1885(-)
MVDPSSAPSTARISLSLSRARIDSFHRTQSSSQSASLGKLKYRLALSSWSRKVSRTSSGNRSNSTISSVPSACTVGERLEARRCSRGLLAGAAVGWLLRLAALAPPVGEFAFGAGRCERSRRMMSRSMAQNRRQTSSRTIRNHLDLSRHHRCTNLVWSATCLNLKYILPDGFHRVKALWTILAFLRHRMIWNFIFVTATTRRTAVAFFGASSTPASSNSSSESKAAGSAAAATRRRLSAFLASTSIKAPLTAETARFRNHCLWKSLNLAGFAPMTPCCRSSLTASPRCRLISRSLMYTSAAASSCCLLL